MRQHILATALAAAVTALAYGQNLNPTVEVTNAYEGGASSINKPAEKMAVPDSVTKFNLDFDYSVFEKPYKGAYEFSPYYVQLKPAPKASTTEKFYLRAGAGFTLHPELDLVWTPVQKEKFLVNVYATHHSYFGRYYRFEKGSTVDGLTPIVPAEEKMKGFLTDSKAGFDAAYGWDGGIATVDIGYRHRMADNAWHFQKMGGLEASARVRSLPSDEPHFLYDAAVKYHLLGSDLSHTYYEGNYVNRDVLESAFSLDGSFGPVLNADNRVLIDLNLDLARYMHAKTGYTGLLSVTPKYQFNLDNWHFSLGAKVAAIIYSEDFDLWSEAYQHKSGTIFPDVYVDFHLLDDQLILQASATGGDRFNTFSGRFFSTPFTYDGEFGHGTERIRAMIGARGSIAARFRYDLQGGYARWSHSLLDGFFVPQPVSGFPVVHLPAQYDQAYNLLFADLDYGWKSEHVTVDGRFSYRHTNITGGMAFAPAAFTGFIRPAYHWGDRFQAGVDVAWSTSRRAVTQGETGAVTATYSIPGWVDLGLFAEYRFTHNLGFWAKGGNLLNQVIQRTPLIAEAGMYFTAGIVLNF